MAAAAVTRILPAGEGIKAWLDGVGNIVPTIIVLLLAWSLASIVEKLGTVYFVVELIASKAAWQFVPAIIFVCCCVVSFAAGSYGCMFMVMPMAIPIACAVMENSPGIGSHFLPVCVAGVLSGGIFGDHCSPMTDCTILAALGSGCEVDCRARQPGLVQLLACHPAEEFSGTGSELKLERLYTFFYQECASDFYFRGEQHEAFELVYVDRGELHNLAGGADVLLRQQQLMLIGRNVWHMQYADRPVSFLTVSFRAAELPCSRLTGRALSLTARQIGLVRQMLEAHGAESYAYDCVESLLKLLLADLLRGLDRQPSADAAQPLPATSHTERRIVDRLVQLISARAGEKLSLQALADEAHISTTYLHRLFRSQLGISPGAYIAKIRIEESKLLLRGGALSMGEIAKKLGFSSQQHFSRQFRTVTGMTPSEYVRSLR